MVRSLVNKTFLEYSCGALFMVSRKFTFDFVRDGVHEILNTYAAALTHASASMAGGSDCLFGS